MVIHWRELLYFSTWADMAEFPARYYKKNWMCVCVCVDMQVVKCNFLAWCYNASDAVFMFTYHWHVMKLLFNNSFMAVSHLRKYSLEMVFLVMSVVYHFVDVTDCISNQIFSCDILVRTVSDDSALLCSFRSIMLDSERILFNCKVFLLS